MKLRAIQFPHPVLLKTTTKQAAAPEYDLTFQDGFIRIEAPGFGPALMSPTGCLLFPASDAQSEKTTQPTRAKKTRG